MSTNQSKEQTEIVDDIFVTNACIKNFQRIINKSGKPKEDAKLRIALKAGGCSGMQYIYQMDYGPITELDRFFDKKDIKVIIDIMSYKNLKGSTIDWQNELVRSGFIVSKNPNAESSCSCGNSFKTKNNDIFNKIDALNKDDD